MPARMAAAGEVAGQPEAELIFIQAASRIEMDYARVIGEILSKIQLCPEDIQQLVVALSRW